MAEKEKSLDDLIISFGDYHNSVSLKKLVNEVSLEQLKVALSNRLGRPDAVRLWDYLLQGLDISTASGKTRRFACVEVFLDSLLKVELSYKQSHDLIARLCGELNTFSNEELIKIVEHSVQGVRMGDPKCVSWKDLLPATLKILEIQKLLNVNGVSTTGAAYRNDVINNLIMMRWPKEVLTPVADMFKCLYLRPSELTKVIGKLSDVLQSLPPTELPSLAFQLFSMCTSADQIIIPIFSLERYFYRFYYKKLFADMDSNTTDFDSIDAFSDKELREAEETILHHLNYCTLFQANELQLCRALRHFQAMPEVILSPFMLSAILSMSFANREPDSMFSSSCSLLLVFLGSVISNKVEERQLAESSVWSRECLQRKEVDLEQVFTVLIDQNKDGKDIVTPGLVNLAFFLLKNKQSPQIHNLAISFLTKFIRKRFVFGQGIIKKIANWMIFEQDQKQFAECLTLLSVSDTFTVSECTKTIKYVMDFFLWMDGEQVMRMMSFILPTLKISPLVRNAFIEVLRKAINSCYEDTRRMAVYGFCMILKQLNNAIAYRSQCGAGGANNCTQQSMSGFSFLSQASVPASRTAPQAHFDLLTMELLALLRICFDEKVGIKQTLYENLIRAVELNPKLVPHVLQFIDGHFRSYFSEQNAVAAAVAEECNGDGDEMRPENTEFQIQFEKLVRADDAEPNQIIVCDNLGRLLLFVSHCLLIFEKFENECDVREIINLLETTTDKVIANELKLEQRVPLNHLKCELFAQQINLVEGLMAYAVISSKRGNEKAKKISPLFKKHKQLRESLKNLISTTKKSQKKSKGAKDTTDSSASVNITINGVVSKKPKTDIENIWDLEVIEKLLRLLHDDIVPFALPENTTALRSNVELVRYVLEVTSAKIRSLRSEPDYKQLAHSKRMLKYLTDITKIIYERCIKRLIELWRDFDEATAILAAECFCECLQAANAIYKKKFVSVFMKGFDMHAATQSPEATVLLQNAIDGFMAEWQTEREALRTTAGEGRQNDVEPQKELEICKIPVALLHCLEVLYDNMPHCSRLTTESYSWLLKFCKQYDFKSKDLCLAHKLLFVQRQKTHSGAFFKLIAIQLGNVLGNIVDDLSTSDIEVTQGVEFKSINLATSTTVMQHLRNSLRKQIEDVEYFIGRANNMAFKYRISQVNDRDLCLSNLHALERSICSQLVHISNVLLKLTNVCVHLGSDMDALLKLLTQHYACLKNLTLHFLSCVSEFSNKGSKFDALLRVVGKPLPRNIYSLITYIEANMLESAPDKGKTKINPKADKAKILRDSKFIPKLIRHIENFNKHVIRLSGKTSNHLVKLLHHGVVRDYRINVSTLKAAVSRTRSHSSQIESVSGGEQDVGRATDPEDHETEIEDNAEDDDENADTGKENETDDNDAIGSQSSLASSNVQSVHSAVANRTRRTRSAMKVLNVDTPESDHDTGSTPDDASIVYHESEENSRTQLLRNLAKINSKAKKRALESDNNVGPSVKAAPVLIQLPKRPRRSVAKK